MNFGGYRVVLDTILNYAHIKKIQCSRKRTWKERFCTKPWKPWVSHAKWTEERKVEADVVRNGDTICMHPKTWEALKEAMDKRDQTNGKSAIKN